MLMCLRGHLVRAEEAAKGTEVEEGQGTVNGMESRRVKMAQSLGSASGPCAFVLS